VFGKVGLEDRTGEKDVKFIPEGEGTVGTVPVGVREIGDRGGIVMMGGEGTVLTTETRDEVRPWIGEDWGGRRANGPG
jgi:hypothetical protein